MKSIVVLFVCMALVAVAVCQDTTSWTGPIFGNPPPAPTTQAPAPDATSWTGPIFGNPPPAPTTKAPTTTMTAAPTTTITSVDTVCLKCVKYLCLGLYGFTSFINADRRIPACTQPIYSQPCQPIANNQMPTNLRERIRLVFVKACIRYVNANSD